MVHPHQSVSSSIYSALESEHRFRVSHRSTSFGSQYSVLSEIEETFGSEDEGSYEEEDSSGFSVSYSEDAGFAVPAESSQTLGTFMTANGSIPSLTSINNSLLRTETMEEQCTSEETPQLDQEKYFKDNDKTPLIGAWPNDSSPQFNSETQPEQSNPFFINHASTLSVLPTGYRQDNGYTENAHDSTTELASKFQRLSTTLLRNGSKVSAESQQFQLNFSLNVQRDRGMEEDQILGSSSTYYQRISGKPRSKNHSLNRSGSSASDSTRGSALSSNGSGYSYDQTLESPTSYTTKIHKKTSATNPSMEHRFSTQCANGGLNIMYTDSQTTPTKHQSVNMSPTHTQYSSETNESRESREIDMSALFVRAIHSFDSTESQLESDNSVCLSFNEGDLAFVHTIDDSGWGEVTLLDTLDRGWIPMNFFVVAVAEGSSGSKATALPYSHYMGPLLNSCGKFLSNPLSHTTRSGRKSFSIKIINSVRDGVRSLLQETDCLSRTNEIVIKRPFVRKCRKSLLSDWYTLMMKAGEYRNTSNYDKIEILTLLVFQVTRRAAAFFEIWAKESQDILKKDTETLLRDDMEKYPLLREPPNAKQRVAEINSVLFSYSCLFVGRLDLVEHNPGGCDLLETMVHHIILLLRELLFISKTSSDQFEENFPVLDSCLDDLLSLVSQIVNGVKSLIINTLNEPTGFRRASQDYETKANDEYSHTYEGKALVMIAAKMINAIASTINCIRKMFDDMGDFRLSSERAYPDYSAMRIAPQEFIRSCSVGIVKSLSLNVRDLREMKQRNAKSSNRYSTFRSGGPGDLRITPNGINSLHKAILIDTDPSAPFSSGREFQQYLSSSNSKTTVSDTFTINDELLLDANGNLLGASFKGIIYTLTNENTPPEYFFVSTFFISFRNFSSGLDLAESLIGRFESDPPNDSLFQRADVSLTSRLRNRQKIVCKLFQIWMESYWDHVQDSPCLTTLINFFNEGVCQVLPFEGMNLIEIAARLVTQSDKVSQFLYRSISLSKTKRRNSLFPNTESGNSMHSRYSMVDDYELSSINTNSSVASSFKSMTLPMPLEISAQNTATNSLLTKTQLNAIETLVSTYRAILRENWISKSYLDSSNFIIQETTKFYPKWYALSNQSWVLSNYRPNLLDFNGMEIAKQLTLIESEIFCAIQPKELINQNYTEKKARLNLAPNVRQSLLFTNCLSEYVLESVLQPEIHQKVRVNVLKTWLKIAISCLYLRNFNSLAAIITSLQSHSITRLNSLWNDLPEKYTNLYNYLCGIILPEKNYSVYRAKLKSFLVSNEYDIPVMPYFSLFLQDLTFVTDGNSNYRTANTFLKQKLINIDKYFKVAHVIADIERLQIPYTCEKEIASAKSGTLVSMGYNSKRDSGVQTGTDDYAIASVPALKELILLELWKVSQLNKTQEDRAWKLSCTVQPKDVPQVRNSS